MSQETITHLENNVLIGYTSKRGQAWWTRAGVDELGEPNHYEFEVPVEDVRRRLLDWQAVEGDVTATAITDSGVLSYTDPDRKAIMRSDNGRILGIFKQGYRIHQYDEWLVQNVESLLDADLAIGSAGLLKNGAVAWVQVEMEETISVQGVDFRPFLTAATSLDGSLATSYFTGAQVVVCDNTLAAGVKNADKIKKIRHSRNSLGRLGEVRDALQLVHGAADAFAKEVEELSAITVTDTRFNKFAAEWSGRNHVEKLGLEGRAAAIADRKFNEIIQMWNHDERVAPFAGTAFGVVQAVNTYTAHVGTVKGDRAERNAQRIIDEMWDELDERTLKVLATV